MMEKEKLLKIAEEVKERILSKEVDDTVVKLSSVTSRQVRFAKNEISVAKNWDETTLSVLVDRNNRVTSFDVGLSGKERIDSILPQLSAYLENAPKKQNYAPLPEPADTYPTVKENYDKKLQEKPEKLVDYVNTVIDEGETADIDYMAGAIRSDVENRILLTSTGAELAERGSRIYLDVRASAGEQAKGHSSAASAFLEDIDPQKTALRASEYAEKSKNPKNIQPGEYTTVFIPDATAALLSRVGMAASAFYVQMGYSFLQKPGEQIASKNVTLIDDPHYPKGFGSKTFDDEGQPTQKNHLLKHGKLTAYLHNRFTANSFDQETTGNAGWIQPHAWQLKLESGKRSQESLIANIDKGLLVGNVTYLRFQNPMKGSFSAVVRDGVFLVEDGEIQHAVKGLRLSDNFPRLLANVQSLGKDQRQVMHWWIHRPVITGSLLAEDVRYTRPVK